METREYFEKVMQDYNQNRKGRSLRKYCKDEAVDYDWLIEFKKSYRSNKLQPDENKKLGEGEFIALTVEENFVPEQQSPAGWQVERLILKSPTGDEMARFLEAACCHKISRETLILLLSTSVQTEIIL